MKVQEILTDESKWTQKVYARDRAGIKTSFNSTTAVSFCLSGAILHLKIGKKVYNKLRKAVNEKGYETLPEYNDNSTFENVKALITELDI